MQLINLICQDLDNETVYLEQFITEPRDSVEADLRSAVREYVFTSEGGAQAVEDGYFTWGEVRSHIPADFWQSHGFQQVNLGISVTITDIQDVLVDENEDLACDLMDTLHAETEHARAETNANAITSTDVLATQLELAGYTEEQAHAAVGLLTGLIDPHANEAAAQWVRDCYHSPDDQSVLEVALNDVLDMHGVESTRSSAAAAIDANPDIRYLEAGDLYNLTLLTYEGDWYCATLGDVLESIDQRKAIPGKLNLETPTADPLASSEADLRPTLG